MKKRSVAYTLMIIIIAWSILILVLCTMPPSSLPKIKIPHIDKAAHFCFFFVQSALLSLLLRFQKKRKYWLIVFLSTLQAFVYGGVIELLQDRFFSRSGDWYDLLADILGGFCGAIVYPAILGLFNKCFRTNT